MKNWKKLFALLLAVVMLLSLTACGKDAGTDVTGKYLCIAIAEDGVNFAAPENDEQYVELKMGGKGEIYTDLAFELTWKLDGENFSGSYKIFGIYAPITGTLKDGVLEIHDDDVVMRYLKEGRRRRNGQKTWQPRLKRAASPVCIRSTQWRSRANGTTMPLLWKWT